MIFNPFSVVLLLILTTCLFRSESIKQTLFNLIVLTASVELFIEIGFFLKISEADLNYRTFCEVVLFMYSLVVILKNGRIRVTRYFKVGFIFLVSSITGLVILLIFPSSVQVATIETSWEDILVKGASLTNPIISGFVIQQTFQFFVTIITLIAVYNTFERIDLLRLLKVFVIVIKIFLLFGCIEFFAKYFLRISNYGEFLRFIFGYSESTIINARVRGFGIELIGMTKEASHYAYSLFVSIVILFAHKSINKSKSTNKWIVVGIVLMMFCMSFSSVLFGIALLSIFVLHSWNQTSILLRKRNQLYAGVFISVMMIILLSQLATLSTEGFFSRRILSLIEEFNVISTNSWQDEKNALEWSNRVRLLSVYMSAKAFLYRPFFGFGLGAITCHGSTIMMLSGVGVIGFIFWVKFFFSFVSQMFQEVNRSYLNLSIVIFLFVNSLNSLALRPFYEFHTFLIAISLVLLFSKYQNNENINNNSCL